MKYGLEYYIKKGIIKLDQRKISRWYDDMESIGAPLIILEKIKEENIEQFIVLTV